MFIRPAICLFSFASILSALEVGRPFGSHMVLPMMQAVPVWGTADAAAEVELRFHGRLFKTTADPTGSWRIMLPIMKPTASPSSMVIRSGDQQLNLEDILIGRVFLCSGQSNMDFPLSSATGGAQAVAEAAKQPLIRLLNLTGAPTNTSVYNDAMLQRLKPEHHFIGKWVPATEKSAGEFSAIAWWMGNIVHENDGVPVGLVENAVGGSGTEAWLPMETLKSRADYHSLLGSDWIDNPKISAWARSRAKLNLGSNLQFDHPFKPGFLFESGVHPFAGFPFEAVIWYQGETNAEINDLKWNTRLIGDLISGWRAQLEINHLPFYIIQLPRIGGNDPLRKHWPEYRTAQADAARKVKNTHLIITEDLGWDSPDVHPPDKRPIAERLAGELIKRQGL